MKQQIPVQNVEIVLNSWHQNLLRYENTAAGELPFIEFTVDEYGNEIAAGVAKSNAYFSAPWGAAPGTVPDEDLPKYISSWDQLYHPDLIRRAKAR